MNAECPTAPRVSVIGLGNIFLGDDGFGPLAVEMFRCKYECGPDVEILDLGTPGVDLGPYLYGRGLVVLMDALDAARPPGTLCICKWNAIAPSQGKLRLTGHDPGVTEALTQLHLLDQAPRELVVIGAVPTSCQFNQGISPEVFRTACIGVEHTAALLRDFGVRCVPRLASLRPNLWWLDDPATGACRTEPTLGRNSGMERTMSSAESGSFEVQR